MYVNLVAFNLIWFGLVYWGNQFTLVAILALIIHLTFYCKGRHEWQLILFVSAIGILVDSILSLSGFYIFDSQYLIPFWLVLLWLCFSATLLHSLHFLSYSRILQALIGLFIAPLSYIAGQKMGAVQFSNSLLISYLVIGFIWACLLLCFYQIYGLLKNRGKADA